MHNRTNLATLAMTIHTPTQASKVTSTSPTSIPKQPSSPLTCTPCCALTGGRCRRCHVLMCSRYLGLHPDLPAAHPLHHGPPVWWEVCGKHTRASVERTLILYGRDIHPSHERCEGHHNIRTCFSSPGPCPAEQMAACQHVGALCLQQGMCGSTS